jgi:hypothetical protein
MRMIQGQGQLTRNPTIQQVDELVHAWEQVQINPTTPQGCVCRLGQLKWTTVLKIVNNMNRQ